MTLAVFTFIRNFSDESKSRFFISDKSGFRETDAEAIAAHTGLLICHDFWMISRAIYDQAAKLPDKIVDLDELHVLTARNPKARVRRETFDAIDRMSYFLLKGQDTLQTYKRMLYQDGDVDASEQEKMHELLLEYYIELCRLAVKNGEFERFFKIEVPCAAVCASISGKGIRIQREKISEYRAVAKHEYYESLKSLSDEFNVPLEVPSPQDIERFVRGQGVDLEEYGLDFAFNYLPNIRPYAEASQRVIDLSASRGVLDSIPVKTDRVFPTVDTQGSRTSRISVRSPFLQSLSKKYRDILRADADMEVSYVDFDQFEVGIMAALSEDPNLHALFNDPDMYESFRQNNLDGQGSRRGAKILFLAYAYGMKRQNLPLVGAKFGFERSVIRSAFKKFSVFEKWKQARLKEFNKVGFVSTTLGNRFYLAGVQATKKERLSAISQIVQGEGSLIFKKALTNAFKMPDVSIMLPMHDAVLFQHTDPKTPSDVAAAFANTMTQHFDGAITGKASVEAFFKDD